MGENTFHSSGTVLITGATSGIGLATAEIFASHGYTLILTGRRKERLSTIQSQLEKKFHIQVFTLAFDIQNRKDTEEQLESLPAHIRSIDILVNNAGLAAGLAPIQEGSIEDWEQMIDTNIKGLLYVSKKVSNWMIAAQKGHIINIGSIAGKETYLNGNVYCATKEAVDALTRGMRIDLLSHKIKVSAIHPGAVETEFSIVRFKGDETKAKNVYQGFTPLTPADVAQWIYYIASAPAHVCINDLIIMPTAQANTNHLIRESQK